LIGNPSIVSEEKSNPEVGVIGLDKFDRHMGLLWKINVVPSVFVLVSVVFKVCISFDVYWKIILLSPEDLYVFITDDSV